MNSKNNRLTERSRTRRSLNDMLEKEAYENGRKHDVNTAAFHRQWTPKNSAQWVEELVNRDWTDPSNPQNPPPGSSEADKETDHSKIAAAFTKDYAPGSDDGGVVELGFDVSVKLRSFGVVDGGVDACDAKGLAVE